MENTGFPPSLYLVGAQKAGTTSLADYLDQHPNIVLSNPKETHYLTSIKNPNESWYRNCYVKTDNSSILLDASTSYSMMPLSDKSLNIDAGRKKLLGIPEKIKAMSTDAKIIYLIRDPVKRAFSHYVHYLRAGYENRAFMDAIENDPMYLEAGYYAKQIDPYLNTFGKDNVLILFFEEFIRDPIIKVEECFDFIGVGQTENLVKSKAKNEGFVFNPLGSVLNQGNLAKFISNLVPEGIKPILKKILTKEPPVMTYEEKTYLVSYYQDKNAELENMLERRIEFWGRDIS